MDRLHEPMLIPITSSLISPGPAALQDPVPIYIQASRKGFIEKQKSHPDCEIGGKCRVRCNLQISVHKDIPDTSTSVWRHHSRMVSIDNVYEERQIVGPADQKESERGIPTSLSHLLEFP